LQDRLVVLASEINAQADIDERQDAGVLAALTATNRLKATEVSATAGAAGAPGTAGAAAPAGAAAGASGTAGAASAPRDARTCFEYVVFQALQNHMEILSKMKSRDLDEVQAAWQKAFPTPVPSTESGRVCASKKDFEEFDRLLSALRPVNTSEPTVKRPDQTTDDQKTVNQQAPPTGIAGAGPVKAAASAPTPAASLPKRDQSVQISSRQVTSGLMRRVMDRFCPAYPIC
jgi:hypothetical protein